MTKTVEYVDHMGTDCSVVNAARVSFAKSVDKMEPKDARLIRYLATHNHWTPFAHTAITLRMAAPIFLARQLSKHQVGGVWNEESRRYITDSVNYYFPKNWRRAPTGSIKQGSGEDVTYSESVALNETLMHYYAWCDETYNELIKSGICPEQARMVLPQGAITHWIWTGSLLFWARVYRLRADAHAQKDLQPITAEIDKIMSELYPISWEALKDCWDKDNK